MGFWAGLLSACAASPPSGLGVHDGHLKDCPSAPHCVSSQATDAARKVTALDYAGTRAAAHAALLASIRALPRTTIERSEEDYIHATQRSSVFGFVDDLECYLPPDSAQIEVRSSSRIGYYDFGVNRTRVEELRSSFDKRDK